MKSFNDRVAAIEVEAIAFIEGLFNGRRRVIHITDPDSDEVYDMPDLAVYHKYGFIDWANIFKITKSKGIITVHCITKESGNIEKVALSEMDGIHVINLASHFQYDKACLQKK